MYDDIVDAKIIDLTKKQRLWADAVYDKYNVNELRAAQRRAIRARERRAMEPKK